MTTIRLDDYLKLIDGGGLDPELTSLYGPDDVQQLRGRYLDLLKTMKDRFVSESISMFSAPGRTELGGNHTDHNNGRVLTAAVHLDLAAAVEAADDFLVEIHSHGFADPIKVDLRELEPVDAEKERAEGLVRGVAAGMAAAGFRIGGFKACIHSTAPSGAGLSSSAAFEVLIGSVFNQLYNNGEADAVLLARIGRNAEVRFFGKPCGLMDQLASAAGGVVHIDFFDPENPRIERIEAFNDDNGHHLVIVDTGGSHADLTDDYAAVFREMQAVAAYFGRETLRGASVPELINAVQGLRRAAGDRAVLRALHFIRENQRVEEQVRALTQNRFDDYLKLVSESGDSSWRFLQNCYSAEKGADQGAPLALALTETFLNGRGACRIHGGGFAGAVQAYIPADMMDEYEVFMARIFGDGAVKRLRVRSRGSSIINAAS